MSMTMSGPRGNMRGHKRASMEHQYDPASEPGTALYHDVDLGGSEDDALTVVGLIGGILALVAIAVVALTEPLG